LRSKISLVQSENSYAGIQKVLDLMKDDLKNALLDVSSMVIKINLVITRTPRYNKGVETAVTPLQAVKSFIDFVSPFYDKEIVIAEKSTWGKTKEGFEMYGFAELAEQNPQIRLLDLKDDTTIHKTVEYPEGKLELPFSKTMLEAPFLVSVVRPKTHCSVGVTAAIKNVVVGAINGTWKQRLQIHKPQYIHQILATLATIVYPTFSIIDSTTAMEGNGPIKGTAINAGWALASFDALTADSLSTHLMGFCVNNIGYLKALKEQHFGLAYPNNKITIHGENPKDLISPFKPHRNFRKNPTNTKRRKTPH
jgi:uncharacterized protein (DUF362 family)